MSFILSEVDRDADSLIAVVLDGLNLVATNGHGLPKAFRNVDLAIAGAQLFGMRENILCQFLQGLQRVTESRLRRCGK